MLLDQGRNDYPRLRRKFHDTLDELLYLHHRVSHLLIKERKYRVAARYLKRFARLVNRQKKTGEAVILVAICSGQIEAMKGNTRRAIIEYQRALKYNNLLLRILVKRGCGPSYWLIVESRRHCRIIQSEISYLRRLDA